MACHIVYSCSVSAIKPVGYDVLAMQPLPAHRGALVKFNLLLLVRLPSLDSIPRRLPKEVRRPCLFRIAYDDTRDGVSADGRARRVPLSTYSSRQVPKAVADVGLDAPGRSVRGTCIGVVQNRNAHTLPPAATRSYFRLAKIHAEHAETPAKNERGDLSRRRIRSARTPRDRARPRIGKLPRDATLPVRTFWQGCRSETGRSDAPGRNHRCLWA